jgi:hypothetical protein
VPVAPQSAAESLRAEADQVVILATPSRFSSVGEWYQAFGQLTDADVLALLGLQRPGFRGPLDQAALARRMRRRRSAERSSSFSPPQVPYFSGRETA